MKNLVLVHSAKTGNAVIINTDLIDFIFECGEDEKAYFIAFREAKEVMEYKDSFEIKESPEEIYNMINGKI